MENRKRNIQMKFYVTEEEKRLIDEKMKQLPIKQYGAYFRKMAIDGYILVVDRSDTKAYIRELQAVSRNINQIAKRANATGTVYRQDIEDIKKAVDEIWRLQRRTLIKSTLKAAIDYILNPEKTDGKLLASSFGCGLETADIEFAWTREAAGDRGTHLGRHLIQSFAVGETTPEEAHKIGMELAGAVLGGKYEFVLTTHVDKDHLHNHLIFNAVSFVDYKKYHSNKQSYHFIRRTSDRICKEHGLSVVVPGQDKGKSYAEYTAEKQGTSYKAKLKTAIDTLIPQVKDFDELLRRLQEMGYEIKQGKYISFRAAGQERFTRTKTLGAAYTEEAIKERIKGVYVAKTKTLREDKKIRLVVDLENSIKAQQSAGYERWAKIHNLKQAAKSMNFLTENKIEYYSELESKIADIMTAHDAAAKAVKEVEQRMSDLSLLIKHTTTY